MTVVSTRRALEESDQAQLLAAIDRWLERKVKPVVKEHDHADRWPAEIVEQMKELGLFGATIGAAYGGLGLSATTYAEIVMRISAGLDVDHRHFQLAPDHGARHREVRHRASRSSAGCPTSRAAKFAAGWR